MNKKEKKTRLLIASCLVVGFAGFLGWVVWSLYAADSGLNQPKAIPYEEIAFTTSDFETLEFALNGQVLTFPVTVAEVEAAGYKLDAPYQNEVLTGAGGIGYFTMLCSARNGSGSVVKFNACNLSEESKPIAECEIEYISAEDSSFILCNGISLESSYEEVIAIMGEPAEYEEDGDTRKLTYEIGEGYTLYIKYVRGDFETMDTLRLSDRTH